MCALQISILVRQLFVISFRVRVCTVCLNWKAVIKCVDLSTISSSSQRQWRTNRCTAMSHQAPRITTPPSIALSLPPYTSTRLSITHYTFLCPTLFKLPTIPPPACASSRFFSLHTSWDNLWLNTTHYTRLSPCIWLSPSPPLFTTPPPSVSTLFICPVHLSMPTRAPWVITFATVVGRLMDRPEEKRSESQSLIWGICHLTSWIIIWLMLISYRLRQTHEHVPPTVTRCTQMRFKALHSGNRASIFESQRRSTRWQRVRGHQSARNTHKVAVAFKKEKGDVSFSSLAVFMIQVGRECILNVWLINVCACVPHQRPAERVASSAAGGIRKKAISCFTRCGYPISYTKHVAKRMYANMPLSLIHVLFSGEPSPKLSDEILYFECNSFCTGH